MDKNNNYYQILGVTFEFTPKELKTNYRNLSKQHHPDKTGGNDEIFKLLSEAYKILTDEDLRYQYDRESKYGQHYDPFNDLLDFEFDNENQTSSTMKDKMDDFKKKEMIHIVLKLDTFKEDLSYNRVILCNFCEGRGQSSIMDVFTSSNPLFQNEEIECNFCDGSGMYENKECKSCDGDGYIKLGFSTCVYCDGDGLINKDKKIKIKKSDIKKGKGMIKYMGNYSKYDKRIGNLYIIIKDQLED